MKARARHRYSAATPHAGGTRLTGLVRFFALLLLIAQFGLVAHRIEHYIAPDHMECGEDACAAFMPTTGAADLPVVAPPIFLIVFFPSFWTVRESAVRQHADHLGFQAHAPPF